MKTIILSVCLLSFSIASFSQDTKENGTIYIDHPYIETVKKAMNAYLAKDDAINREIYADTSKYWVSGQTEKPVTINDAIKMWDSDFDYYDSIKVTTVGYPDYLAYTKDNSQVVQSWWTWTGKSKKTGEAVKINFVQFDEFNKEGKIGFEFIYGDFSKMVKE